MCQILSSPEDGRGETAEAYARGRGLSWSRRFCPQCTGRAGEEAARWFLGAQVAGMEVGRTPRQCFQSLSRWPGPSTPDSSHFIDLSVTKGEVLELQGVGWLSAAPLPAVTYLSPGLGPGYMA